MKTLAIYNIKGGVGKTATAVNMAYLAAREGQRVLFWDLDPQGSSTYYFRIQPKVKGGSKGLFSAKHKLLESIKGTDYPNLDLLPADFSYRKLDHTLMGAKKRNSLRQVLKPLRDEYDLVILDCPPSISVLSENVFTASDALMVPLIPTTLSLRTFEQLLKFFRDKKLDLDRIWPFFSMVDRRKKLHRDIVEIFPGEYPGTMDYAIPNSTHVELMGLKRSPVHSFAPRCPAAIAYDGLWTELRERLENL
ncbi:MAG: cobyrinic acid a,c-diamide synthase [Kordiimonas sp.]|nr:cobyrinic acid a,c-diamide synthase [Kordiimonas sp.]